MIRKTKIVKNINYKGFNLFIIDNCFYGFRYEYQIKAISKQNKFVLKKRIKPIKNFLNQKFDIAYDPTSHKCLSDAIEYGVIHINELRHRISCPRLKYI